MPKERHYVYVIELDKDVLYESKFKKANPEYEAGKPCVYVGMTGLDPDTRFDQHKAKDFNQIWVYSSKGSFFIAGDDDTAKEKKNFLVG